MSDSSPTLHLAHGASPPPAAPRERLGRDELAVVLSRWDLGTIHHLRDYPRGSHRAPKVRLRAQAGEFVLKRRAPAADGLARAHFSQAIVRHLELAGLPVAAFRPTRDGATAVAIDDRLYELSVFVHGRHDGRTPESAAEAGRTLARVHDALRGAAVGVAPASHSYHDADRLDAACAQAAQAVTAAGHGEEAAEIAERCDYLRRAYEDSARRAAECGVGGFERVLIHGDFHPGNLLFAGARIAAVLDFDAARTEPRVVDVANACLQFSHARPDDPLDPDTWPEHLETARLRAFLAGYDEAAERPLTRDERAAVPWLVIEALVHEGIAGLVATGRFAGLDGAAFLRMLERRTRWLRPRAAKNARGFDA